MDVNSSYRRTVLSQDNLSVSQNEPIADFVFAHGAGAGKDSDFMQQMAELLEKRGIKVHLFNFEYMAQALLNKKRRPPSKMPILCDDFKKVVQDVVDNREVPRPLFIGGKSMGSRVACEVASKEAFSISGTIAYGYPFHPPKKPEKSRLETLTQQTQPCLVVQGESDALGSQSEIQEFDLPDNIRMHFISTANHDLKPLKRSGLSHDESLTMSADETLAFIKEVI
ncbi:alpha/beta hydrolase [Alteromonadaceae bacterium M269]|nr:alpha/beta hydrolase [Alteromonadaceae bacterium M269]